MDSRREAGEALAWLLVGVVTLIATCGSRAEAQDGGTDAPRIISVKSGTLLSDDGKRFEVTGGGWLRDDLLLETAQDKVRLTEENRQLRATPAPTPVWVLVTSAVFTVVGFGLGVWATFSACRDTSLCR